MWLLDPLFRHDSSVKSMEAAREALFEKEVVPRQEWCHANRFLVRSAKQGKAAQQNLFSLG